jgi:IS605 OrfB family transposase
MEKYFDGSWKFGTAKLILKNKEFYLHIPVTKDFSPISISEIKNVVGVDFGMNFLMTTYDSNGKTFFFNGRKIKDKRAKYKMLRSDIQKHGTSSARSKIKDIGGRESRWVNDVCHSITKDLISRYGSNTLFVIEDLSGIRKETEKVRREDRYVNVSWPFDRLRKILEYKAGLSGCLVLVVDPRYTSQSCPKCGHTSKDNRIKKEHRFECRGCGYRSNDDRVAAMNLQGKGVDYVSKETIRA